MLGKHNLVSSLLKELGARGDAKGFGFGTLKAKGGVAEVLSPEEEAKRLARREKLVREMVETEKSYVSPEEEAKRLARREKLVREMVETEKSYVSQLDALDECYMTPLIKEAAKPEPPLTLKMCDVLFLNVRSIKSMNETTLLTALEKALATPNQCIGQALIDFAPFFQLYKDYIANHVKANDLLEQLNAEDSTHVKFKAFCATALADPKAKNLSLASLLITPIQRVPRYKMLLDEIRKNTPPSHADVSSLDKAYALVSQAAIDINEAVRSQENRTFLMDMQENMFTTKMVLVKPGPMSADRVFIRKGLLTKVCRSSDKPFTFFLFSNMLMYGVEVRMNLKEKYKISHQLPIDGHFQVERNDQPNSKGAPPKYSLKIVNNVKSFVVYAKDEAEYESWFKDLQKCVAVLRAEQKADGEAGGVKPIWISDKDSKACTLCHTDFTVIRRRHHCRKCGTLCCGDCSKARIDIKVVLNPSTPVPPLKKGEKVDKVRVCVSCVGIIRSLGGDVPLGIEGKGLDEKKHLDTNSNGDIDENGALSPRTRAPSSSVTSTMDGGTGGPPRVAMMGMGTLKMGELNRALSVRQSGGMSLNIKVTRKCGQASCGQNALDRQPYCRAHTAGSSLSSAFEVPIDVTNGSNGTATEVGDIDVEQRVASTSVSRRVPPPPPGRTVGPPPLPSSQPPSTPIGSATPSASPPATPTAAKKGVPPPPKRTQTLTTPINISTASASSGSVSAPPTPGSGTPPNASFLAITPTATPTTANGNSTVSSSPVSPTPPARPAKPLFSTGSMNAHAVAAALAAGSNATTSSTHAPSTPTATASTPVATATTPTTVTTPTTGTSVPATSPPATPKTTITVPPSATGVARTPSKTGARIPPPPPSSSPSAASDATPGSYTRALPVPKSKAADTPVVDDDTPPPLPPPEPMTIDTTTTIATGTPPSSATPIAADAPTPTASSPTPVSSPTPTPSSTTGTSSLPVGVPGAVTIHARPSVRTGIPPPPPPPRASSATNGGGSVSVAPPPPRVSSATNGIPPPPPPAQGSATPKPTITRGVPPPPPAKK